VVIVLMGVSGTGKTTVGKVLAAKLGWDFVEGDDYHPVANVEKMRAGIPLTDEDRRPWLQALRQRIEEACEQGANVVVACSALKREYRQYLERDDLECVDYVFLHGSEELIRRRLAEREGHFMDPNLLQSQLDALEVPHRTLQVDITPAPEMIADEIRRRLRLGRMS
jgi:gluconokinase